jgi:hypothetical protein
MVVKSFGIPLNTFSSYGWLIYFYSQGTFHHVENQWVLTGYAAITISSYLIISWVEACSFYVLFRWINFLFSVYLFSLLCRFDGMHWRLVLNYSFDVDLCHCLHYLCLVFPDAKFIDHSKLGARIVWSTRLRDLLSFTRIIFLLASVLERNVYWSIGSANLGRLSHQYGFGLCFRFGKQIPIWRAHSTI